MKHLNNFIAMCVSATILTACGGGNRIIPSAPAEIAPVAAAQQLAPTGSAPLRAMESQNLYVANYTANAVTVYAPGSTNVLRTISQGISEPDALAFGPDRNLYVANQGCIDPTYCHPVRPSSVTVYAPGSKSVLREIRHGVSGPSALAFDGSGDLYVANHWGYTVTVYAPGSTKVLRTIRDGIIEAQALEFDGSGNLYVANDCSGSFGFCNSSSVTVYAPNRSLLRTIPEVDGEPNSLVLGRGGNLYVSIPCGASYGHGCRSSVSVYAAGSTSLLRKIRAGVHQPDALAFGQGGNLFVANVSSNTVTVYAPGSTNVLRTISQGISSPDALAFGAGGSLYVANPGNNTVTVYTTRNGRLLRTISQGVSGPAALAFGP
ncbi:MAG: SMP-30/gluconolactonase/LRE family protein [Candidatus Eremiobacteraeota bacterium]|nr:SMP-30/gluconolactonase/LRE family protein [Candidatus Eremiobacteraeota bacterium]